MSTQTLRGGCRASNRVTLLDDLSPAVEVEALPEAEFPEPSPAAANLHFGERWPETLLRVVDWLWCALPVVPWWFWGYYGMSVLLMKTASSALVVAGGLRLIWDDLGLEATEKLRIAAVAVAFSCFIWWCYPVAVMVAVGASALHLVTGVYRAARR